MTADQLNYHHLRYFWEVARQGSLRVAAERLKVSQPTISAQVRSLEEVIGSELFVRSGRGMVLTDRGRMVMEFANEIFKLGNKLVDVIGQTNAVHETRLNVGITDSFAKLLAFNLLRPAFKTISHLHLTCAEGSTAELLGQMATGRFDLILADEPAPATLPVRAFSHRLGEAPTVFCGSPDLASQFKKGFPGSLSKAPVILPASGSAWRNHIDHWFETQNLKPRIVAEFADSALIKTAAADGLGIAPVALPMDDRLLLRYGIQMIGEAPECHFPCYLITVERALKHPGAQVIAREARKVFPKGNHPVPPIAA